MKHKVRVRLVAECEVELEVDVAEGDDPTCLTAEEEVRAESLGESFPDWGVKRVTKS